MNKLSLEKEVERFLKSQTRIPSQLHKEASMMVANMVPDEVTQFHQLDAKIKNMERFEVETSLRDLVNQCLDPLRQL
jgi:hypothetical protein